MGDRGSEQNDSIWLMFLECHDREVKAEAGILLEVIGSSVAGERESSPWASIAMWSSGIGCDLMKGPAGLTDVRLVALIFLSYRNVHPG